MPNKQQLKDQFTLRIYNQEDKNLLDKAFERNKTGFDSISDFIRYCVITGVKKLLVDNEVDQQLNLSEIKELLKSIDKKLANINEEMSVNHKELSQENVLFEKLLNYISNVVYNCECNKKVDNKLNKGLFYLPYEKLEIAKELKNGE